MHRPRVLIITANRVLGDVYAGHLETAGFAIEIAESGEAAIATMTREVPDAVLVDMVLPDLSAAELLNVIQTRPQLETMPVFAFPTLHIALPEAAVARGCTSVLPRSGDPVRTAEEALRGALHLPSSSCGVAAIDEPPAGTVALLNELRAGLHTVARDAGDRRAWRRVFVQAHHVSQAIALAPPSPATDIAAGLEALAADIAAMPDQANSAVLGTMSQATDFLGILLQRTPFSVPGLPGQGRVLIVDDEPSTLQLVAAALQFVGLVPVEAATPCTALAKARDSRFDLILLDVGLPEMSGFDLCSELRATSGHDRIPIVFLTGMATFGNRARSSLSGGNDFVAKPFHVLELGLKALIWTHRGRLTAH